MTLKRVGRASVLEVTLSISVPVGNVMSLEPGPEITLCLGGVGHSIYTKLNSRRFSWRIVSLTAANTKRIFSVSVAHVK